MNADALGGLMSGVRTNENSVWLSLPKGVALTSDQQALVDQARAKFGSAVEIGYYEGEAQTSTFAISRGGESWW